jgi:hypothetical protein
MSQSRNLKSSPPKRLRGAAVQMTFAGSNLHFTLDAPAAPEEVVECDQAAPIYPARSPTPAKS